MGFVSELKRRNVLRMAALYLVSAWLIMQVAEVVIGLANMPEWVGPLILVLLAVGLPIALVLSWFYELTPEGVTLDTEVTAAAIKHARGRRIDVVVIAVLCAAVMMFAYDKWWPAEVLEQSIAVLAFENMSGDPEQDYLSDGIAEELLNALAKIPELHVTSRSSSFSFKNQNVPISEVAQQLNVSHVLEGSVRKSGERIRITAQLIDAASDKHLWSETYDRQLDDIFVVQDDIAGQICEALKVRLLQSSGEDVSPAVTRSAELVAYDAYLQGREILRRRDHRRYEEAANLFLKAVRLDPTFAEAHAQVAITVRLAFERLDADEQAYAANLAIKHLAMAEALNPDFPELHGARGMVAMGEEDHAVAVVHLERALELNPNYADAMNWLHIAYARVGRDEEAEQMLERMFAIDPLSVLSLGRQFDRSVAKGQYAEAHALADKMSVHGKGRTYWLHANLSLFHQGNIAEGLYWGLKMGEELGDNYSRVWLALLFVHEFDEARRLTDEAEPYIAFLEGRFDDAIGLSAPLSELALVNPFVAVQLASTYYNARRFEEALPLFERFFASGWDGNLPASPESGQLVEDVPVIRLMWLADTRRRLGDESGAHEAAEVARQENAKLRADGRFSHNRDIAEAMLAAFDGDRAAAFTALRNAIRNGMRLPFQDQSIFDELRDDPEMARLSEEMNSVIQEEHAKILQLICFENPTPNAWRPLPETCAGVTDQPGLLEFRR